MPHRTGSVAPPPTSRPLVFALNGTRVELASVDPSMTLLNYIRSHTPFTGTKLGCGEGGCGACVVLLSKYDVHSKQVEEFSINSCLALLCSLDGCAVTTTEGLGSTQDGFHAVHKRLAGFHGSQCGFCSPGMCMSIYSGLRRAQAGKRLRKEDEAKSDSSESLYTLPELTMVEAQRTIVGNICRCTGYRPILDSCKSFAGDVEMEDLGLNAFWPPGKQADAHLLPAYSSSLDPSFPKFLVEELEARSLTPEQQHRERFMQPAGLNFRYVDGKPNGEERIWVAPITLEGVFEAIQAHQGRGEIKLVVGNTTAGIYKDLKPQVFIDISRIPELLTQKETRAGVEVGAAVTIEKLIHMLEASASPQNPKSYKESVFYAILSHLKKVANPHVRSRASVGGNLIIAQQFSFESDLATIFLGAGVLLQFITRDRKHFTLTMEEFLQAGLLDPGMLLQSIFIPSHDNANSERGAGSYTHDGGITSGKKERGAFVPREDDPHTRHVFKTYRAAPRPLGNALAYINAAFLAELSHASEENNQHGEYIVKKLSLAFGAFGTKHAIRAKPVEEFLVGKTITPEVLLKASDILKTEAVVPAAGTSKAEYRSSVAVGFFFNFLSPFLKESLIHHSLEDKGDFEELKADRLYLNVTSGKQKLELFDDYYPVGQPTPKLAAEVQAAGEAVYVDDIPAPENCLFAAFVYSKTAYAKIKHVDLTSALASVGVVSYISADDIPRGGENIGVQTPYGSENLFASEVVECVGHPLGIVVADTAQHAKDAAEKVKVDYDSVSLGSPVLSIEEAVNKNSFFTIPPSLVPEPVGNVAKGFAEAEQKIENAEVQTGAQYFFYMENNTALAVPDEDNCLLVYSPCQGPENLQQCISTCLGLPSNNIRVITRRAGGGFGGKLFRSITVATACALAAYKLRKPVRMYLDRNTDAIMMGGRHPTKTVYSVGFKSTGKVTALQAKVFVDAGWSPDVSPGIPYYIIKGMKKYNWEALDVEFKVCKTNLSSKSAMRGPGVAQGSFIADTVIEHIAAILGLDVHTVFETNMHTVESASSFYSGSDIGGAEGYTLPSIWGELKRSTRSREETIRNFNHSNRWLKRGLGITPCVYELEQYSQPGRVSIFSDGSVVVEVGGVEIGQGLWTKVKQTVLFGLRQIWQDEGNMIAPNVRVVQADSISLVNGGFTFNSTTSEGSCEAVRQACKILVDRLMPTKVKLEKDSAGKGAWGVLIKTAKSAEVDLSAQFRWSPAEDTSKYLTYGAAAAEVQIDVLTGETIILQADLIFDCGKSLNPAIDIGQIEGSFMQGVGFLMTEEYEVDSSGKVISDGTWNYKPPTMDTIPHQFNVEIFKGVVDRNRILSSKATGEPPLLMAKSVHTATRRAIEAAREDLHKISTGELQKGKRYFRLDSPATLDKIKTLCGLDNVEQYLKFLSKTDNI